MFLLKFTVHMKAITKTLLDCFCINYFNLISETHKQTHTVYVLFRDARFCHSGVKRKINV